MIKKQHKLKITGMHCTSCSMMIDGDLEDTAGVISASTHYAKQETEIVFDEEQTSLDNILAIVKKTGYEAVVIYDK